MRINELSFPHPVLGLSDDVIGHFKVSYSYNIEEKHTNVVVDYELKNSTLEKMLSNKQAVFCTEIECGHTIFRRIFTSSKTHHEIQLDSADLRDKVNLRFFLAITCNNENYSVEGANDDYSNLTIPVEYGDVLAYGGVGSFVVDKVWEGMKGVHPFLIILKHPNKKGGPFEVDLTKKRIVVFLSEIDFEYYSAVARDDCDAVIHAAIVLPVLIFALGEMMRDEDEESFRNCTWFEVLQQKISESEEMSRLWKNKESIQIAQLLLKNPFHRALVSLEDLFESSGEPDSL